MKELWYETWFNSKYYHILYQNRNDVEAQKFLDKLIQTIPLNQHSRAIDIGCGKGRHAIYLHKQGMDVHGIDLSEQSIKHAKKFEEEKLCFEVFDMRHVFKPGYFDIAFNLFTSFGYFDSDTDDYQSLESMSGNLKKEGILVLDYLNITKVEQEIGASCTSEIEMDGILFKINKQIIDNFVEKSIHIKDGEKEFNYLERVKALRNKDFKKYMNKIGLSVQQMFGDYQLNEFNEEHSDRMIFIACKK